MKEYNSKQIANSIQTNIQESRKEWLLWMLQSAGAKSSNVKSLQFWQHNNKPIELFNTNVTNQKIDYIHQNQVVSGLVMEVWHWKYSSARSYCGKESVLEIDLN